MESCQDNTPEKPERPHPDFPLTPRKDGRWCKRVHRKLYIFKGTAAQALDEWLRVKDYLLAGRNPPPKGDFITVLDMVNAFILWKGSLRDSGELAPRTYGRYYATCEMVLRLLGKTTPVESLAPNDFERMRSAMSKQMGKVALSNEIGYVRGIFKYAHESGLIDAPVLFGPGFARPKLKHLRAERKPPQQRLMTPEQIKKLLKVASVNVRAMVLLGINGGFGNTDLALLPISAVDLKTGWLTFPRPKTGIDRRVPLWPETIAAIRAVVKHRREPASSDDSHLLFIGARGESYVSGNKGYRVSQEFSHAASKAIVVRTFYDLRRTFQTVGEECLDLVAVGAIMGHAPLRADMGAVYRQGVSDERLRNVTSHIHRWLFTRPKGKQKGSR